MGKTGDLFKKIRDTKGKFHAKEKEKVYLAECRVPENSKARQEGLLM